MSLRDWDDYHSYYRGALSLRAAYRLVRLHCPDGGVVLDPFCGVGTVLVAGRCAGRGVIGGDVDVAAVTAARADLLGDDPDLRATARLRIEHARRSSDDDISIDEALAEARARAAAVRSASERSDGGRLVHDRPCKVVVSDAIRLVACVDQGSIDACITVPPYFEHLSEPQSYEQSPHHSDWTDCPGDRNAYRDWLADFSESTHPVIRRDGRLVVLFGQEDVGSECHTVPSIVDNVPEPAGFRLVDLMPGSPRSLSVSVHERTVLAVYQRLD